MRIEKIESNKIKVTLFLEDLEMFNINVKKMKPNSPELHSFLCEVLKKVRAETNFDPYDGQVVVEATPNGDGLVLLVSKLMAPAVHKEKPDLKKIKQVRAVKKTQNNCRFICCFDEFEALCDFLKSGPLFLKSSVLYKAFNKFFLAYSAVKPDMRLREFARVIKNGEMIEAYLKEHGEVVAKADGLYHIAAFLQNEKL